MLVTVLAESVTTGLMKKFTFKPAMPEKGLSLDLGTLSSREKESETVNYCDGRVMGLAYGNNTYTEKTFDFTVTDDFAVAVVDVDPTIPQSTLDNMIMGGVIKYAGDTYNILGIQGVKAEETLTNYNDFMYFFYQDGRVINPNKKKADGTGYVVADNAFVVQDAPVFMLEAKYAATSSNIKGVRIPYALGLMPTFNEGSGTSTNKIAYSAKRLSDVIYIEKYSAEGLSFAQPLATTGTDALLRVEAKMVIEVSGGGTPTVAGVLGDQVVVVDTADGTVELYKHDGTDFGTAVTSTLAKGAKIFATSVDTALNGLTAVTKNVEVAIKTAGATGVAVAVNCKTNADGSGTATYILENLTWDYEAGDFALVTGTI